MKDVKGLRVVVAGAGAVGSVCALALARHGARVILADPADAGDNASGVAAGMLAPVAEALLDSRSQAHLPLLRQGRDAWDRLLPDLAQSLDRSGAVIEAAEPESLLAQARALGAELAPITAEEARRRCPGLAPAGPFLFTPEDWRLEPAAMLAALHQGLVEVGGERVRARVAGLADFPADVLIRATGPGQGFTPIKGQILRFPGAGAARGPVVRGQGIYVAPSPAGAIAGATMEEGVADRAIDADTVARLREKAVRLFPALDGCEVLALAGVRAATPDGLPLVGAAGEAGVLMARGARRNGWLLAPLIAEVLLGLLAGRAPSAAAMAFDPARFN